MILGMNNKGQGLTEYIILLVLVTLVAVGATRSIGTTIRSKIDTARNHINSDINFSEVNSRR